MKLKFTKKSSVWMVPFVFTGILALASLAAYVLSFIPISSFQRQEGAEIKQSFREAAVQPAGSRIPAAPGPDTSLHLERLAYDSSFILFGKPKDWTEAKAPKKIKKPEEIESPLDLIGTKTKAVIESKMVSTLEDMGVADDKSGRGRMTSERDSVFFATSDKKMKKARPITEEEAIMAAAMARRKSGLAEVLTTSLGAAMRWAPMRAWPQLKLANRLGRYALAAEDPDMVNLLSGAYATGEDPRAAVDQIDRRGQVASARGSLLEAALGQVLDMPMAGRSASPDSSFYSSSGLFRSMSSGSSGSSSSGSGSGSDDSSPSGPVVKPSPAPSPSPQPQPIPPEPPPGPVVTFPRDILGGGGPDPDLREKEAPYAQ